MHEYLYLGKVQLAMQILKTLHPKLVPVTMFLHWKSQKELRVPEDSASAEDKVEFMGDFNILLLPSKRAFLWQTSNFIYENIRLSED